MAYDGVTSELVEDVDDSKHPLHDRWVLSYSGGGSRGSSMESKGWSASRRDVYTVETVEEFWCVFNNLITASKLPLGSDYMLFREGIKPEWEDLSNISGGKWTISIASNVNALADIDTIWLNTVLALIGESLPHSEEICGALVSVRNGRSRVAIWTRSSHDHALLERIGHAWKELLGMSSLRAVFQSHAEAMRPSTDSYSLKGNHRLEL